MEQEALYFRENNIIKKAFHKNKNPIDINEVDVKEIVLSHKKSNGKHLFKYLIGYGHKVNAFPSPLCTELPQMNEYAEYFVENNKYMNLLVNVKEILEKQNKIWNNIKNLIKKDFNSEPMYNDKYIKTKIKFYNDKVYKNVQLNKYQRIMNIACVYL